MKRRTTRVLLAVSLLVFSTLACGRALQIGSSTVVDDPPAPTAVTLPGETPASEPATGDAPGQTILLPDGFEIDVFAEGLNSPRMMDIGPDGWLYVAERGAGRIIQLPDADGDGKADSILVVAEGLESPSSLDFFEDGSLYVGETTRVIRLMEPAPGGEFMQREVIVSGLPSGGHNTRTVLFSPDYQTLFVSVGSSCNVCEEQDERRAAIMRYNPDGSKGELFSSGLRNAVGITFRPGTDELWATNNGRDMMGDDQPPENIYLVQEGVDYGWPRCHSGRIEDPNFGSPGACEGVGDPMVEMQAHSAPLGLGFYTGDAFPEEYQGDLFVAFHGSWNRSVPTGYKVVRIRMQNGAPGAVEDFASGWLLQSGRVWGRPVDVVTGTDGSLFVSDDAYGKIYRITYTGG